MKTPNKSLQPVIIAPESRLLYWIRARMERSQYERPPKLLTVRTNTVAARQAETVRDEVLGGSNGRRDQMFRLANTPVLPDSLRLEIDEGCGSENWTRQDDFFGSGPLTGTNAEPTTGEIRFGDGIKGDIPVKPNNPEANIVAREYRFGGGKRGNLPARAIKTLTTSIDGMDNNEVGNLLAADSGRDEETLEPRRSARHTPSEAAPARWQRKTSNACHAGSPHQAGQSAAAHHPDFPGVKVPGVVTMMSCRKR